jgi:hypothetical protein
MYGGVGLRHFMQNIYFKMDFFPELQRKWSHFDWNAHHSRPVFTLFNKQIFDSIEPATESRMLLNTK